MQPKRRAIRLREYDYSQNGAYFITVCTKDKSCILWKKVGADIIRPQANLSEPGMIAEEAINGINRYYPDISVEKYCIMPNHIHLLIMIDKPENGRILSAPTISTVVGQMKRWASKKKQDFRCGKNHFMTILSAICKVISRYGGT